MKNSDKLFYDLCVRFAEQSQCKGRHVGCVLVYENKVIGQGYNGAPEGSDCSICPRERCKTGKTPSGTDLNKALCVHSEANAIGYCARHGISTRGATIYITTSPCSECSKLIVAAGIKEVVYQDVYPDDLSFIILKNANILVRGYNFEN